MWRNSAKNLSFHYRLNWLKINNQKFQQIQKILFLDHVQNFGYKKISPKNLAVTQNFQGCIQRFWGTFLEMVIFTYWHHGCLQLKIFCGIKYVTIEPYNTVTELASFTKNYLKHVKTGRNDSKFTIGKYPINTREIIKLFWANIFMPEQSFLV